jgi:hypothetical protein
METNLLKKVFLFGNRTGKQNFNSEHKHRHGSPYAYPDHKEKFRVLVAQRN